METTIDEKRLKALLRETIEEVLEERREMLYEIIAEVIEDIGLANAIREGEKSEIVSPDEIDKILEGKK